MASLAGLKFGQRNILSAFKANNVPEAIIKGYGSKAITKIVQNLAGGLIPNFSYTLPIVNVSVDLLDILRYFALTGGAVKFDLNALVGTLVPLLFPNPTGYTASRNVPAPGYTNAYGG